MATAAHPVAKSRATDWRRLRMHEAERRLGALSRPQENLFTRDQFLACGLSSRTLSRRVACGRLQRVLPGVYLSGYAAPTFRQQLRAALLLGGDAALLSHRSAAWVWQMLADAPEWIDLTVLVGRPSEQPGLRIHRSATFHPRDRLTRKNLVLTSPIRTLCDLAVSEPVGLVGEALTEAQVHGQLSETDTAALDQRLKTHRGAARVRALIAAESEHGYTRSKAERLLRGLLKSAGLPMPRFNARVHDHLVDCHWPESRVVLEVDGYETHRHRSAFEADRRRDQDHAARGYLVVRVTWRQLTREPARVLVRIAETLATARLAT